MARTCVHHCIPPCRPELTDKLRAALSSSKIFGVLLDDFLMLEDRITVSAIITVEWIWDHES